MELKVEIGFEELLTAIKKLPPAQIMQLKEELSETGEISKNALDTSDFQKLLLNGPVMDDKQYKEYKSLRNRLNKWRAD
ncbi:MAG: hypothetical protein ABIN13_18150 [Mucilaginibacter sp.]